MWLRFYLAEGRFFNEMSKKKKNNDRNITDNLKSRNSNLDSLRGLAILTVMMDHFHSDWLPGGGLALAYSFRYQDS